jgi:hypothetical protein
MTSAVVPPSRLRPLTVVTAMLCGLLHLACQVGGGGGSVQRAPDTVKAGETAGVRLELSVWGAGRSVKGRYTDVQLLYRRAGTETYSTAASRVVQATDAQETYEFDLVAPAAPGEIEYYITLKLDGHPSRVEGLKKIRITE